MPNAPRRFQFSTRLMLLATLLAGCLLVAWRLHLADDHYTVHDAIALGDASTVRRIARINPDAIQHNRIAPLYRLAFSKGPPMVEAIFSGKPDLHTNQEMLWADAVFFSRRNPADMKRYAKLLFDAKADINQVDANGNTVVHQAALFSHYPGSDGMFRLLKRFGASFTVKNEQGQTPWHLAAAEQVPRAQTLQLLAEFGADVNAKDKRGRTVLHEICADVGASTHIRQLPNLETMLTIGANPNLTDENGDTPLHHLCRIPITPNRSIARSVHRMQVEMLKQGADVNIRNNKGETPLHLAVRSCTPDFPMMATAFLATLEEATPKLKPLLDAGDRNGNTAWPGSELPQTIRTSRGVTRLLECMRVDLDKNEWLLWIEATETTLLGKCVSLRDWPDRVARRHLLRGPLDSDHATPVPEDMIRNARIEFDPASSHVTFKAGESERVLSLKLLQQSITF